MLSDILLFFPVQDDSGDAVGKICWYDGENLGILYIVATPIGNLDDITMRALEVLRSVDVIACEDTRRTLGLLNRFSISKRLISCRSHNERYGAGKIVGFLKEKKDIAFVSDAGTPGLSDPGGLLVSIVRKNGFRVIPIPGASALAAILSVSGVGGRSVTFDGFLSPKPGKRRKRLKELADRRENFVLYESPNRLIKLIRDLVEICPERDILVGKEMTKKFEEYFTGIPDVVLGILEQKASIKGEYSIHVSGKKYSTL